MTTFINLMVTDWYACRTKSSLYRWKPLSNIGITYSQGEIRTFQPGHFHGAVLGTTPGHFQHSTETVKQLKL